jgi:hypothetical protein
LDTLPGALGARLAGKYLGSAMATLLPVSLEYAIGTGHILTQVLTLRSIPTALAAFATILLPASL